MYSNLRGEENIKLYVEQELNKNMFRDMVLQSEGNFYFRNGIIEFFKIIEDFNITLFIVSAGMKDIIDIIFETMIPNFSSLKAKRQINILGNAFRFDENNNITGYETPVITTFNKNIVI